MLIKGVEMAEKYEVNVISTKEKRNILSKYPHKDLYEKKADIHGTCTKLFTDNKEFSDMWTENFKPISEDIRPHCRVFALNDETNEFKVNYEPLSKTVIIKNCNYYGWVKSIALGLVADFFEDFLSEHRRYSIHGSLIDSKGQAIGLVGPSGVGKTTLTYGLLLDKKFNFLTDDWFFVRLTENEVRGYSAEKNSYIRDDIAQIWTPFAEKLKNIKKDSRGRSIVDIKRIFGDERIKQNTVLKAIVLLRRNPGEEVIKKLTPKEAMDYMLENDFCNPHQLIRDGEKYNDRVAFYKELFTRVDVHLLNTIETPQQSLERIKGIIN